MATTTNLGITKLEVGQAQKEATINAALDTLDAYIGNAPKARAYHSSAQSISNNTQTALALNSERYDTDTIHDTSTNNSRLTCKTAGKYKITGGVSYATNTTGVRQAGIRLNGTTFIASVLVNASGGTQTTTLGVTTDYALAVNEYVELMAYQDSGGALNVEAGANYSPEFMMVFIGK